MPTITIPGGLTVETIINRLEGRDNAGFHNLPKQPGDVRRILFHHRKQGDIEIVFTETEITLPDDVPQALVDRVQAKLDLLASGEPGPRETRARQLKTAAEDVAGVRLDQLTNVQLQTLVKLLLVKAKAVDLETGEIRPLDQWLPVIEMLAGKSDGE